MPYQAQVVRYLDADLEDTARHIANKPGNTTVNWAQYSGGADDLPGGPIGGVVADTRLVILGHGDRASTSIGYRNLSAERLARVVERWLGGTRIRRISLHMCYGGGNRGQAGGSDADNFAVHPNTSFAYRFASYAGQLTVDVAGRTDVVGGRFTEDLDGNTTSFYRTVGGRRKAEGDKVIFTTSPASTIQNPVNPTMAFTWQQ